MKTKEEMNALKEEVETMRKKLSELSEEEFACCSFVGCIDKLDIQAYNHIAVQFQ